MAREVTHQFLMKSYLAAGNKFSPRNFTFKINRVGSLRISSVVVLKMKIPNIPTGPEIPGVQNPRPAPSDAGRPTLVNKEYKVNYSITDPLGTPFTRDKIKMEDLNLYRDLRGIIKPWSIRVEAFEFEEGLLSLMISAKQFLRVEVIEDLQSSSAPALLDTSRVVNPSWEFSFDLYRLGKLVVNTTPAANVKIVLMRPDGSVMSSGTNGKLEVKIEDKELKWSRGPLGVTKPWKFRFEATGSTPLKIFAQVYDTFKISTAVLSDRLNLLFKPDGKNITIAGNWVEANKRNIFTVTLHDEILAENFQTYEIIDPERTNTSYDSIEKDIPYVVDSSDMILAEPNSVLGIWGAQGKCNNLHSDLIQFSFKVSEERRELKYEYNPGGGGRLVTGAVMIPANLPTIAVRMAFKNSIKVIVSGGDDAELVIPNLVFEMAFSVVNGRIVANCWIDPESVKLGGGESGAYPGLGPTALKLKLIQAIKNRKVNEKVSEKVEGIFDRLMGGVFSYTSARWNNQDKSVEFDYIAGNIPDKKPNPGYQQRINAAMNPPSSAIDRTGSSSTDTWRSTNLNNPDLIKHIVVLMMENRSFDHVLGHLSLPRELAISSKGPGGIPPGSANTNAINPNVNGLTTEIIKKFSNTNGLSEFILKQYSIDGIQMRHLNDAGFPANEARLKTKFPLDVGHSVEDVLQQLENNTMNGFVKNFIAKHQPQSLAANKCHPQDVLGYYTGHDLPMFKYLASEYAICDNYYCSHPGPTLPNRMYQLTGELQRDRNGEPRINNGVDSSFFLSRDQTICDILSQQQVSWRVYESVPSVTMLRMFTKYAGDNSSIRNITSLETDIQNGDFPSVVFIDPAMHDAPPNDDHPPSDMLHGQHLIKKIYDALKLRNENIWKHTLFVITYDEHGGLFDHVPPGIAETLQDPRKLSPTLPTRSTIATKKGKGATAYLPDEDIQLGLRVPTFLISPYVEKGSVYKQKLDHTSILKSILLRFCNESRPFLSDRVQHANSFGDAIKKDFRNIQTSSPTLPDLANVRKSLGQERPGLRSSFKIMTKAKLSDENADFHEFVSFLGRTLKQQ